VGCAGANTVWVLFVGDAVASNHRPYVLYRSGDGGQQWAAMLYESYTASSYPTARASQGPGSYPGPFATDGAQVAALLGWSGAGSGSFALARTVDGGRSWQQFPIAPLNGKGQTNQGMAFVNLHGWIATSEPKQSIYATSDGGRTWHDS